MCETIETKHYEDQLRVYATYESERRSLCEKEHSYDMALSTALISVSGGAIGLSLTWIKDLSLHAPKVWLFVAWGLLVLTLSLGIVNIKLQQVAYARTREILDEEVRRDLDKGLDQAHERHRVSVWRRLPSWIDWLLVPVCVAGLIFLAIAGINAFREKENHYAAQSSTPINITSQPADTSSPESSPTIDPEGATSGTRSSSKTSKTDR